MLKIKKTTRFYRGFGYKYCVKRKYRTMYAHTLIEAIYYSIII